MCQEILISVVLLRYRLDTLYTNDSNEIKFWQNSGQKLQSETSEQLKVHKGREILKSDWRPNSIQLAIDILDFKATINFSIRYLGVSIIASWVILMNFQAFKIYTLLNILWLDSVFIFF